MTWYFLLPVGLWVFQVAAVVVTRIAEHGWSLRRSVPGTHKIRRIEYFGKFISYDAAKVGTESWMLAAAIILVAAADEHSRLRGTPPELAKSVLLGVLLLGMLLVVGFLITLALWVYLEGHAGSRWWEAKRDVEHLDRIKWATGLTVSAGLGVLSLSFAAWLS